MDDLALLRPKLARLKLSGMLDTLNERLQQALAEKWSYTQFLDTLLTDEAERRDFKQLGRRLTKSGLAPDKTLETFDFSFNPRIHAPTLRELATCRFVQRAENVFLVGPSGVGKSHAAQALGHIACRKGYEVTYERTSVLFDWIHAGRGDGSYQRRLRQVGTVALLMLDDFGLKPLPEHQQQDLYEVICNRYERHATVITSNRDFNEWPLVFANPLMGSAAMGTPGIRYCGAALKATPNRLTQYLPRRDIDSHPDCRATASSRSLLNRRSKLPPAALVQVPATSPKMSVWSRTYDTMDRSGPPPRVAGEPRLRRRCRSCRSP